MLLICVACGDEFKEVTPEGPITTPSIHDEIFEKIAPLLKDTTGFDRETMGGFENMLACVKDGKLWVALLENDISNENPILKEEWLSTFNVPENTKLVFPSESSQTSNGNACLISFNSSKDMDDRFETFYWLYLLNDGTIQIFYQFEEGIPISSVSHVFYGNNSLLSYFISSEQERKQYLLSADKEIISTNVTVTNDGDSYFLTGFQNDKLRIDVYDENTGKTKNWISETAFDKTLSIHQGYGEYINYNIDSVRISDILPMDWGYVTDLTYIVDDRISEIDKDLLILNDQGNIILMETEKHPYISYRSWYNNSFLIQDSNIWTVISPDGEEILNVEDDYFSNIGNFEPISYDEIIKIKASYSDEWIISLYNLRDQTTRWETKLDVLSANMESDAKLSATIHKNGNIWQYQCDILYYDGNTRQVSFTINIETGALL